MKDRTYSINKSSRVAETVVPDSTEERTGSLFDLSEFRRRVNVGDMLFESLQVMVRLQFPALNFCIAYRAVNPWLKGLVVTGIDSLDGNILVTTKGSNDSGLVGKDNPVGRVGREKTLEEGDSRVKYHGTLTASFCMDVDLMSVH
jgi:hypothetical protein